MIIVREPRFYPNIYPNNLEWSTCDAPVDVVVTPLDPRIITPFAEAVAGPDIDLADLENDCGNIERFPYLLVGSTMPYGMAVEWCNFCMTTMN